MALLLFLAASPFIDAFPRGRHLEGLLATLMLASAVPAVGGHRGWLLATAVLATPIFFGYWFQSHRAEGTAYAGFIASFVLFAGFIIARLLYFILRAPRVTAEVLAAGISVYVLLGMLWATLYALTARLVPGAFTGVSAAAGRLQGFEALYFSFITLTTVGYGDVAPAVPPARMLAMMEAMTGTLYLAVLISRLVSLHAATATPTDPAPGPEA